MAAWSQPHRHYHDQQHLRECLALWARWRDLCPRPADVALGLWFHNAIYDQQTLQPGANELASAAWAARSLVRAGVDSDTAQRVYDLVMATRRDVSFVLGSTPEAKLLADIVLSILGSPPERFERYEQDLRKEYGWMLAARYRRTRARVMKIWLDRPRLYHAHAAVDLLDRQARINLTAALASTQRWLAQ